MEQIVDTARHDARFDIFWSPADRSIALFSSQTVVTDRQQSNIAVIIGIGRPVEKVYVGCL